MDNFVEVNVLEFKGKDYIIVEELTYNNIKYIYAIKDDDTNDVALFKELIINQEEYVEQVVEKLEFDTIMKELAKKLSDKI